MQLNDLDFADDLLRLLYTQQQMQEKTISVVAASEVVGLNIHREKSKILGYDTARTSRMALHREALEDEKTFTYLNSIIDEHGGYDANVKARIGKARTAYLQLKTSENQNNCLLTNTRVRISNTNVETVLLCVVETWRTTKAIIQKIQVFINSCLRKILKIR
ncbi:unnamed protein product [Schistosoma curassoni]|uniref:Reverse transcriptase domain-containing protein n=1 Tax=Schistosoma curassoni TaxID=6186 RepID=A0A183KD37_9TREM|nr:unnamed protein product [Schistosoma curassoni]